MDDVFNISIRNYRQQLSDELDEILKYWINNTPDHTHGGFYPRINNQNHTETEAAKGAVLNARILWTFSAAYNLKADQRYIPMATRAYQYIVDHFIDKQYGGVYWSVNYLGEPLDTKKQVYAAAFAIYGLSEYYLASGSPNAKKLAVQLYQTLVHYAYDNINTGYFEAFTRDWKSIDDLRLSEKDENEKKTMNTHLHVLEAYACLYKIWPDAGLKIQIETLLKNFNDHFINPDTKHLSLFFDEYWLKKSDMISYGHDIEASWLLLECATTIGDDGLISNFEKIALQLADRTFEGIAADGGLWYEYEPAHQHLIKEKHWWVQAEAMVGFYNAWQLSNNPKYLQASLDNWDFVKKYILDKQNGEWFWGVYADGQVMAKEDKVGMWKCPYHNSRACIEIIKRTNIIQFN